MFTYATKIKAIDPKTGELCEWFGPNVQGISRSDVRAKLDQNGLGYCRVEDRIVETVEMDGTKQEFIFWN